MKAGSLNTSSEAREDRDGSSIIVDIAQGQSVAQCDIAASHECEASRSRKQRSPFALNSVHRSNGRYMQCDEQTDNVLHDEVAGGDDCGRTQLDKRK